MSDPLPGVCVWSLFAIDAGVENCAGAVGCWNSSDVVLDGVVVAVAGAEAVRVVLVAGVVLPDGGVEFELVVDVVDAADVAVE